MVGPGGAGGRTTRRARGVPVSVIGDEADADRLLEVVRDTPGVADAAADDRPAPASATGQTEPGGPPKVVDGQVQVEAVLTVASDSPEAEQTVLRLRDGGRRGRHRRAGRRRHRGRLRHQAGVGPRHPRHHPGDPGGDLPRARAAAAGDRRAAAARGDRRAVVPRHARRLRAGVRPRLRLRRRRPVVPAVRVRVPGRARHRLQHLPDDPGARGGAGARHPSAGR